MGLQGRCCLTDRRDSQPFASQRSRCDCFLLSEQLGIADSFAKGPSVTRDLFATTLLDAASDHRPPAANSARRAPLLEPRANLWPTLTIRRGRRGRCPPSRFATRSALLRPLARTAKSNALPSAVQDADTRAWFHALVRLAPRPGTRRRKLGTASAVQSPARLRGRSRRAVMVCPLKSGVSRIHGFEGIVDIARRSLRRCCRSRSSYSSPLRTSVSVRG